MQCTADAQPESAPPTSATIPPSVLARLAQEHLLAGRIREALAGFQALAEHHPSDDGGLAVATLAGLVECRLARGDLPAARGAAGALDVAEVGVAPDCAARAASARGELAAAEGDAASAVEHFLRAGVLLAPGQGPLDPSLLPWRTSAALALTRTGSRGPAVELASEHLALGESAGSARAVAQALRVLAITDVGGRREALLRQARDTLALASADRLAAQIDTDLAGLLLLTATIAPSPAHDEAMTLLRGVEEYAATEDLWPLRSRVRRLAERYAGDRPSAAWDRLDQLTMAERRVVGHAVEGLTNRQIADEVGVGVKSVEWQLSRVYRKLGISSRRELGAFTGIPA